MDGILPIYKPVGITSYDVIREFKRSVHPDFKIGHGGTLDPFADGVLLLLMGKATKKMTELSELPKTYRAMAILGASSDTLDKTGVITPCIPGMQDPDMPGVLEVRTAAVKFVGEIEQVVPDYSATKINGVPRYKLARQGISMEAKSKKIKIYAINDIRIGKSNSSNYRTVVAMTVKCSAGTYIRQLSYDILKSIGIESYLEKLTRTEIGEYKLDKCCQIADFSSLKWQDMVVQL